MMNSDVLFDLFGFYEENRFYRIDDPYSYYVCEHLKPVRISVTSDESQTAYKSTTALNFERVEMKKFIASDGVKGYAGKCAVCGKVYYWTK